EDGAWDEVVGHRSLRSMERSSVSPVTGPAPGCITHGYRLEPAVMQARGMAGHRRDHPHALTSGLGAWRPEPYGLLARFYRSPRASGNGPARRLHTTCSYHHPWNPGMAARMRCLAPIRRHDR